MIRAVLACPSGYVGPTKYKIRDPLLEKAYNNHKLDTDHKLEANSKMSRGLLITIDSATIHKVPLTNVVAVFPNSEPLLLNVDDATDVYAEGDVKDAEYYYDLVKDEIVRLAASNVTLVLTDDASVMVSFRLLINQRFPSLFVCACACHLLNTWLRHAIQGVDSIKELVRISKVLIEFFNNHAVTQALIQTYCKTLNVSVTTFIIPSDTRFGLYILMFHRLLLLRPVLLSIIYAPAYLSSDIRNVDIEAILTDVNGFWQPMYDLVIFLLPGLRLIRIADSDTPCMGKIHPLVISLRDHMTTRAIGNVNFTRIVEKYNEMIPKLSVEVHKAAYCVDPEFWDNDVRSQPDVMESFQSAVKKVFHFHPKQDEVIDNFYSQFNIFRNKQGPFASEFWQAKAKSMNANEWWIQIATTYVELRFFAIKLLDLVASSSAAERDWKDYKGFSTKARAQMAPEKVQQLKVVSNAMRIKSKDYDAWRLEMNKFGLMEHLLEIDIGLERAQGIVARFPFNNWMEDWETLALATKNPASEGRLKAKYVNLYFYDTDVAEGVVSEVRRIVDIEWKERQRAVRGQVAIPAQYQIVSQLVYRDGEKYEGDEDLEAYCINDELHLMITDCAAPFNDAFQLNPEP
jgi:hypothetical protein